MREERAYIAQIYARAGLHGVRARATRRNDGEYVQASREGCKTAEGESGEQTRNGEMRLSDSQRVHCVSRSPAMRAIATHAALSRSPLYQRQCFLHHPRRGPPSVVDPRKIALWELATRAVIARPL